MKTISTNHLKFYFVDSRHNAFHWLVVVLIRIAQFVILIPFSAYLAAIGFFLSVEIIHPYSPPDWLDKAIFYSNQLPYFLMIKYLILSQVGHWYHEVLVWRGMVIGIPLILLATSIFLINLFNLYYSIFSRTYNRTHCPLCKEPIKIKTK